MLRYFIPPGENNNRSADGRIQACPPLRDANFIAGNAETQARKCLIRKNVHTNWLCPGGGRWWFRTTDLHDVNVALYP